MEGTRDGVPVIEGSENENFRVMSITTADSTAEEQNLYVPTTTENTNNSTAEPNNVNLIEVALDSATQDDQLQQGSIIQSVDEMGNIIYYVVLDQDEENIAGPEIKIDAQETGDDALIPEPEAVFVMPQDERTLLEVDKQVLDSISSTSISHYSSVQEEVTETVDIKTEHTTITNNSEAEVYTSVEDVNNHIEKSPQKFSENNKHPAWQIDKKNHITLILEQTEQKVNIKKTNNTASLPTTGQNLRQSSRPRKPKVIEEPGTSTSDEIENDGNTENASANSQVEETVEEEALEMEMEIEEEEEEEDSPEQEEGQEEEPKTKKPRKKGQYTCSYCQKILTTSTGLQVHEVACKGEKPFSCEICGKRFNQKGSLHTHLTSHTEGKQLGCQHCGRKFKQTRHLREHINLKHQNKFVHQCEYCNMTFLKNRNYREHMYTHTGERPWVCQTCGKGFAQHSTLNRHLKTHGTDLFIICNYCKDPHTFKYTTSLRRHMRKCHPDEVMQEDQAGVRNFTVGQVCEPI